jgi:hypothetical protein
MNMIRMKVVTLGFVSVALAALQGCFSVPVNLRSDPAGATVLANGKVIGTTPMRIYADRVFPHKRKGIDWRREGTLTLERPGCTPKTMDVDNDTLKRSLTVDLECRPDAPALNTSGAAPGQTVAARSPVGRTTGGTAERLNELEELRRQGLITDQEYRSIRKRILEQL